MANKAHRSCVYERNADVARPLDHQMHFNVERRKHREIERLKYPRRNIRPRKVGRKNPVINVHMNACGECSDLRRSRRKIFPAARHVRRDDLDHATIIPFGYMRDRIDYGHADRFAVKLATAMDLDAPLLSTHQAFALSAFKETSIANEELSAATWHAATAAEPAVPISAVAVVIPTAPFAALSPAKIPGSVQ